MDKNLSELQLKHRQEMKEKRNSINERKARTHRLIVRGAIAESLIDGSAEMSDADFQDALLRGLGKKPSETPSEERTSPH